MKRRYLIIPATVLASLGLSLTASAHTPNVTDSCSGLSVNLTQYEGSSPNNRVTVTIDGASQVFDFGGSFTKAFSWSQTSAHAWTVVIDANRNSGNPTQYDKTFNGTEQPCQTTTTTTTTTTVPATTTTTTPATTVPATTTSPPTTTTAPTTTTTTAPSSTTQPPASSTSTTPTTSSVAPTTSIPNPVDPTVPPTTPPPTVARALPETGVASDLMFGVAAGLFLAGCAAMGFARRRT